MSAPPKPAPSTPPAERRASPLEALIEEAGRRPRSVRLSGQLLEVWVQPRPTNAATIAAANRELASVRVRG